MQKGWLNEYSDSSLTLIVIGSVLLHFLAGALMIAAPFFLENGKSEPVIVMDVVQIEKPKIRIRKPKTPRRDRNRRIKRQETPKYTHNTEKNTRKTIKASPKPDTLSRPQKVESHEQMVPPKMVMQESGDPRLRFWAARVVRIFKREWNPPRGFGIFGLTEIKIDFTVERSGKIRSPRIASSSGNGDLDQVAQNVVERVGKLPPIPPNYREKDRLTLGMIFKYQGD